MMSYLRESEAEKLQNGDVHLAQTLHFGMGYLENRLEPFPFKRRGTNKLTSSSENSFDMKNEMYFEISFHGHFQNIICQHVGHLLFTDFLARGFQSRVHNMLTI